MFYRKFKKFDEIIDDNLFLFFNGILFMCFIICLSYVHIIHPLFHSTKKAH
jgi:hypothetical protein